MGGECGRPYANQLPSADVVTDPVALVPTWGRDLCVETYRFDTVMHRYCFRGLMLLAPSRGGGEKHVRDATV